MLLASGSSVESFVQFLTVFVLFCIVLAITYATTRWIARFQKTKQSGTDIEVLETCRIAPNAYIQIVRTGQRFVAIAVCKDSVTRLAELSGEELHIPGPPESQALCFREFLEKAKGRRHKE